MAAIVVHLSHYMGLFSNSKNYKLKLSDFKTESTTGTVTATWISPELLKMLPNPPRDTNSKTPINFKTKKAAVQLFGGTVEVIFDPDEIHGEQNEFILKVNNQLNWIAKNRTVIGDTIAQTLLELKNSTWLDTDESPLTANVFLDRITLKSVEIFDDGAFELSYDDGDIFDGHSISVFVTADRKIEKPIMEG